MLRRLIEADIRSRGITDSLDELKIDVPPDNLYFLVKCMVNLGIADDLEDLVISLEQCKIKELKNINLMGQCNGLATMGMQSILLDDVATYDQRIKLLLETEPDELLDKIKEAKEHLKEKKESKTKPSANKLFADIPIFLEDVVLAQSPWRYSHLYEEKMLGISDAMRTLSIVMSKKLEEKNVTRVTHFSNMFSADSLATFFQRMRRAVEGLKEPIAFILTDENHRIVVGYNPSQKPSWSIIEGQMVSRVKFDNILDVAEHVNKVFSPNFTASHENMSCFTTEIYTSEKQARELTQKINPLISKIMEQATTKAKEVDSKGCSLLHMAAREGDPVLVKALLKNNANPNAEMRSGVTPLMYAAANGHMNIVESLIKKKARATVDKQPCTALFGAAARGHVDIVKFLLSKVFNKSDPNRPDEKGITPISAAAAGGFTDIMQELLKHKINLNIVDKKGMNPLMFACRYGQEQAARLLLENKLNPNEKNKIDESTSLHYAIEAGNINIVNLVLTKENINATRPCDIDDIFKIARKQGKGEDILKFLFKGRERDLVSATHVCEMSPLGLAVLHGQPNVVRYLLEQGANHDLAVDKKNFDHVNLLSLATALGHKEIVKILTPLLVKHQLHYFGDKQRSKEEKHEHKVVAPSLKKKRSTDDE